MICALAPMGFINGDIPHNKNVIIRTLSEYSGKADIILFGEAFLQGFYAATFDPVHDEQIAVSLQDPTMEEIRSAARQYAAAVSFGFIEKADDLFFSSQITIGADGGIIDLYRRVSPGWKEAFANDRYREGDAFHSFSFMGKKIVTALCGDLWFDENTIAVRQLAPDVVFWPVYTDFNFEEWNTSMKHEYAEQAAKACKTVLYVNSFCKDKEDDEIARGGAALFQDGHILQEIPAGSEGILLVDL